MKNTINHRLVSGVFWNTFEKIIVKTSTFIISVILARLLSPSDYGLVGMLTVFITLCNIIIEGGFAKAIIQKQDCKDIDYSTTFVTNVSMSVVIYLILHFSAPLIAIFYKEPLLIDITRVLGLNIIIGSFNIIQRAKLIKAVDFKSLAKINFISVLIGGTVGIYFAYNNGGVWSLIAQSITSTTSQFFLFRIFSRWKVSFRFSILSHCCPVKVPDDYYKV